MRILRWLALAALHIVAVIAMLWASGALFFDLHAPQLARQIAAALWFVVALVAWFFLRPRWGFRSGVVIAFALLLTWWFSLEPRQDREWRADVAVAAHAEIVGERFTLHNVRNFEYRTETDYTPRSETRTYDMANLRGVDLFLTYWGSPHMSHPIFSFDFGEQGHLCFSIETRPEKGEAYSAIGGLYRQYELIYIAADERDVVRLRTNYRKGEEVYLYRLAIPPAAARARLDEYLARLNALHARPAWYNAVTNNCTTSLRVQREASKRAPWDWRILVNGYADEMLYEHKVLDTSMPFADLKQASHINEAATAAGDAPDFSARVRAGRPGFSTRAQDAKP